MYDIWKVKIVIVHNDDVNPFFKIIDENFINKKNAKKFLKDFKNKYKDIKYTIKNIPCSFSDKFYMFNGNNGLYDIKHGITIYIHNLDLKQI